MTDAPPQESTPAGQPAPAPAAAAAPQPDAPKTGRGKALAIAGTAFAVAGLSWLAYDRLYGQYHEHTDDAYVQANLVYVNAQVGGTVTALGADDNQPVKAGQTLVRLDQADAAVAQADAEAQLALAVRQVRGQLGSVAAAQAVVAQRRTDLARASEDLARRQSLAGTDSVSAEEITHAKQALAAAQDALALAERQLEAARAPVAGTTLRDNPAVLRARAAFVQAALGAQRDEVQAPTDGVVARRSVQVGQRVAAGAALMAVVPLQGAWVDANFKEPQLRHIQVGQPATVSTDLYGGRIEYHGTVASIAAGSGGAFSLLPPQNATGNWIKVVQRVPVRIALDPKELAAHPLRVGLSTDVTIDTRHRADREPPAQPLPGASFATSIFDAQLRTAEARADALIAREAGSVR
jgi:membrane fusion protein (multidrug efflux system)